MRRREFIVGVAIAGAMQGRAQAQHAKRYRIAIVHPSDPISEMGETGDNPSFPILFKELRRLGYVEGANLIVERYSGEGRLERDVDLARNAISDNPDAIFAVSTRILLAFKQATTTVPIVGIGGDPVAQGLVPNLARPGGNITGVSVDAGLELYGKRLGILKEAVPHLTRVALLIPRAAWEGTVIPHYIRAVRQAAEQAGVTLIGAPLASPIHEAEYRRVFAAMGQEPPDALIVEAFGENLTHRRLIVELAREARLPAIYPIRDYVEIGGLMAYATSRADIYRRAANQIDEIFKGAKPGDIPFHQPTKFELIINLKTVSALGVTIPPTLLARADELIE
jgi:putative ABC transport system substrate-binding protein